MPDELSYGRGAPTESELRLLGPLAGKRLLVLGCHAPAWPVTLAGDDAKVVALDPDLDRLDAARRKLEAADVRAELHHGDLADLAFVRADTIDAAVAVGSLGDVADLGRVFRQVHRVLRPQGPLVVSLPHPAAAIGDGASWFDRSIEEVFTALVRSSFTVDSLLEPLPRPGATVPSTLIIRGKK